LNQILKHPIISSVIAGLILYISTQVEGFWSSVWNILCVIFIKAIYIFEIQVSLPLWIIFPIFILLAFEAVKRLFFASKRPKNRDLSKEEINILNLIVKKDGEAVSYFDITTNLKIRYFEAEQIIEALSELKLIESYENAFDGIQIYLTIEGRDFILGNKFKCT
jgi:hypothetical protein